MIFECDSSVFRLHVLDTVNLAFVRAVHNNDPVLRGEIELVDTSGPGASLFNKLRASLVKAIVCPVLPDVLFEGAVIVESKISLGC